MGIKHKSNQPQRPPKSPDVTVASRRPDRSSATPRPYGRDNSQTSTGAPTYDLTTPDVVAIRQRHDRTHLIVDAGECRYHVTVSVARDHKTGRAISFRYWIRNEQVTLQEQDAIDAAVRAIAVLEGAKVESGAQSGHNIGEDGAGVHAEVIAEQRRPGSRW